ncbi:MAG: aminotransferase class IV [Bacteroidota bacterium]
MIERAFVYGDLLFESMLVLNNEIQNVSKHYKRLCKSATILKMQLTDSFTLAFFTDEIQKQITLSELANKQNCRVRFILYRNSSGFYLPDSNKVNFIIEVFELSNNWKEIAAKPKRAGIYTQQHKAKGPLANLKSGNALVYVLAKLWAQENNLDEALIINGEGNIVEAANSNIFWKKNNQIYTVPLSEGCIAGVARETFMEEQINKNSPIIEQVCTLQTLQQADEIFMSNAANGISPIILVS